MADYHVQTEHDIFVQLQQIDVRREAQALILLMD